VHEFLHGAGNFAARIPQSGVPGSCADHNSWGDECWGIRDRILAEMAESRARNESKQTKDKETR
jgi:hypothetical protein